MTDPTSTDSDGRPLVLLDVDGVINDAEMLVAIRLAADPPTRAESLGIDVIQSHGHHVAIPRYMPELVQTLVNECEVWWCSTWRSFANDEIATHLAIDPLPYIDDGTRSTGTAWKVSAAQPTIAAAQAQNRPTIWIEDFNGTFPDIDSVTFIVTGPWGVLRWSDLDVDALTSQANPPR